jgi:alanine-synthesizing transaminase
MAFTVPRPSILIVNYPSNPTAETVDLAFYERLVAWAKENKVWVLSDLAYSELYYDGNPTVSILQVPGAKDVAVEFTSMSKTYSMAGWRIGFAVGNKQADRGADPGEELSRLWSLHPDPGGGLRGAQRPAGHRREEPRALPEAPRRDGRGFGRAGWEIPRPRASMFAWAPLPPALKAWAASNFPSSC